MSDVDSLIDTIGNDYYYDDAWMNEMNWSDDLLRGLPIIMHDSSQLDFFFLENTKPSSADLAVIDSLVESTKERFDSSSGSSSSNNNNNKIIQGVDGIVCEATAPSSLLQNLPVELLVKIFEYADAKTVRRIETSCAGFNQIVNNHNIWETCEPRSVKGGEGFGLSRKQVLGLVTCKKCMSCEQEDAKIRWSMKKRLCNSCSSKVDAANRQAISMLEISAINARNFESRTTKIKLERMHKNITTRGKDYNWTQAELLRSSTYRSIMFRLPDMNNKLWKSLEGRIMSEIADWKCRIRQRRRTDSVDALFRHYLRTLKTDAPSVARLMSLKETQQVINSTDEEMPIPTSLNDVWTFKLGEIVKPLVEETKHRRKEALVRLRISEADSMVVGFVCKHCFERFDLQGFSAHTIIFENCVPNPYLYLDVEKARNNMPYVAYSIQLQRKKVIDRLIGGRLDPQFKYMFYNSKNVHYAISHDIFLGVTIDENVWRPLVDTFLEAVERDLSKNIQSLQLKVLAHHSLDANTDKYWICLECLSHRNKARSLKDIVNHCQATHFTKTIDQQAEFITIARDFDEMITEELSKARQNRTIMATKEIYKCIHCPTSMAVQLIKFKSHWKRRHKLFDREPVSADLELPSYVLY